MRSNVIAFIALVALVGCTEPITATPTHTPQATQTARPSPTLPASPTATIEPTLTPSPTSGATPTATEYPTPTPLVPVGENLLTNPGFEGSVRSVIFGEVNVFLDWEPFYCDTPYTPESCPAPYAGTKNPADLLMRRPEFKPTALPLRVHGGATAQQWFCFFGTCDAGVYQTLDTEVGQLYEVGAYVQSWANYDDDPDSDFDNPDDWLNTEFYIRVNLSGDPFAFASENVACGRWTYEDLNFYDSYRKIYCEFTANSTRTTVFIGALRNFPIANNDSYVDDAYVIALGYADPPPGLEYANIVYKANVGLNIRNQPALSGAIVGVHPAGSEFLMLCLKEVSASELWASTQDCVDADTWSALVYGGFNNASPLEGPVGR